MTSHPTRAVVLGGGGTVGVAWQTGLLAGLREAGIELADASTIVGTSAGSLVGALLSSGRDVTDALTVLATVGTPVKMLDPQIAARALHIGRRQAEREAATVRAGWDLSEGVR